MMKRIDTPHFVSVAAEEQEEEEETMNDLSRTLTDTRCAQLLPFLE
jgi:hypothetical protein